MIKTTINGQWQILLPEHRAEFYRNRVWEKERLSALFSAVDFGDTVIDVGMEEADISGLLAMWAGGAGDICLIEPSPRVWANAKAIWNANKFKTPKAYFVGFASDVIDENPPNQDFDANDDGGWPACAYGDIITDHGFRHLAQQTDATPQITLDEFCRRHDIKPDIINIDVEGAEERVLRGAREILQVYRPKVFCSIHPEFLKTMYGSSDERVISAMKDLGYQFELLGTDHEVHALFKSL